MIQQQGVCNSSLVLHKSLNLLVSFAFLWQKLQRLLCVLLRKLCQVLAETTQIGRTQQVNINILVTTQYTHYLYNVHRVCLQHG